MQIAKGHNRISLFELAILPPVHDSTRNPISAVPSETPGFVGTGIRTGHAGRFSAGAVQSADNGDESSGSSQARENLVSCLFDDVSLLSCCGPEHASPTLFFQTTHLLFIFRQDGDPQNPQLHQVDP